MVAHGLDYKTEKILTEVRRLWVELYTYIFYHVCIKFCVFFLKDLTSHIPQSEVQQTSSRRENMRDQYDDETFN